MRGNTWGGSLGFDYDDSAGLPRMRKLEVKAPILCTNTGVLGVSPRDGRPVNSGG